MKKILISFLFVVFVSFSFSVHASISPELTNITSKAFATSFSAAKKEIEAYIKAHSDDPAGYLVRGMVNEWYQLVRNKNKTLNSTIMQDYQKARMLAKDQLEKDKNNTNKKMLLGIAHMYIAKKKIDTGHKMQAGWSLKQAKNIMNEVLAKDPNNPLAFFAVGLFNYFAAKVPPGFKWLANLIGFKGDRNKGLQYLQKAASTNSLIQNDARYMLFYIYSQKEGMYSTAVNYASDLYSRYPSNQIFLFNYAEMLFRTEQIAQSRELFDKVFQYCDAHKKSCSREYQFLANYFVTWSYMDEKDYTSAKPYYEKTVKLDTKRFKDRTEDIKKWGKKIK